MIRKHFLISALCALAACAASQTRGAEWGSLTGRFVIDGAAPKAIPLDANKDPEVCKKEKLVDEGVLVSADGGIANAVIMLKTKLDPKKDVNPEYEKTATDTIQIDNKNCRFEPHVTVLRTTQTLALHNSDPVSHNTKVDPIINAGINPILAAGGDPLTQKFASEEALPIRVGCNIHPWMGGFLIVRKDPYAAVSDKDGKFTIKDLPAGKELEFVLWEEKPGYLKNAAYKGGKADAKGRFKIKLKPGTNDLGDIKVSAALLNAK
jgi:hypothetical protein